MIRDLAGKRVLVTGASSGIGKAMALEAARRGATLLLMARRRDRLESVAAAARALGTSAVSVAAIDLLADGALDLVEAAAGGLDKIDVLVNNAGSGQNGSFAAAPEERLLRVFDLDFRIAVLLARRAALAFRRRGEGAILNVASMAALVPTPYHAVYSAAKAALLSFSEALDIEERPHGTVVSALCPGVTETEFFTASDYVMTSKVYRLPRQSAAAVATAGLDGLLSGRRMIIAGAKNRLFSIPTRLLPMNLVARLAGKVMRPDVPGDGERS